MKHSIIFIFEDKDDIEMVMNFLPTINMSIWLYEDWYKVEYIDYIPSEEVFVIGTLLIE